MPDDQECRNYSCNTLHSDQEHKRRNQTAVERYLSDGVDHMLALRGDIPLGETTTCGDFNYATDLVKFVRDEFGDKFEIAVAGSPEGHIACRSLMLTLLF